MTTPAPFNSAIYLGSVVHTRLRPVRHRLRYRMPMLLLDLDELPRLSRALSVFSAERFNLFGFRSRDHLAATTTPLRVQVEQQLERAGLAPDGGPIRLLCMPRVLGSVFNPLSVFFCHAVDGALRAVLYEVNNTFGQRHGYLIPVADPHAAIHRQSCAKQFYVSPFMEMALNYHFRLSPPRNRVAIAIEAHDDAGPMLSACFAGQRRELTDANLMRALLRHPLLAAHVLGGIHWEALKLWRKGMRLRPRPAPPTDPVSVVMAIRQA
ncbi:DUF1365 domain-containing protein [Rhodopila sp.]|uniref:DUF1365 domain-containing protein n=1 Tax=Rhodopila sp. TaxID=2480087 RepID=UPI003D0A79E1